MKDSRWQTVSQIFSAALELPENERQAYIRQACGGDMEMESEVARLLIADENAGSFLERPAITTQPAQTHVSAPLLLANGSIVADRFRIVRFIGQGGMGQVYEAIDLELNSRIALKAIRPEIASDPRMLSRFRREVQLTRMITHPNVCRTFDIERHGSRDLEGTAQNFIFLTMELLEGETLSARLCRFGRLTSADALPLVLQMIDALSAAHAVGVVHRDFKPSNVLLVSISAEALSITSRESRLASLPSLPIFEISSNERAVVTDFGLARAAVNDTQASSSTVAASFTTSLTGEQALMGTLVYMAPEQLERGETSIASDIYSLGLVMFEMVTGQRPFIDQIPFAEATKRLKQPAPSANALVPGLDPVWDTTIARCLAFDPQGRFRTAKKVAEVLTNTLAIGVLPRGASDGSGSGSNGRRRAHRGVDAALPVRGHKMFLAATIGVVVLSLCVVILRHYWMRIDDAKLPEGATVLLTNIQNTTGDKRFDDTTELVRHQLLQSPYFGLMDSDRIQKTLGEMVRPADSALDPQSAREIAMRNGVRRVVFGTVSRVGDSFVLDLDIEEPDEDPRRFRAHWENHWTWDIPSATSNSNIPGSFLSVIRDSSDWLRRRIGESVNDIAREDTPPEDVTTGNWEALSEFARAERFRAAGQNDGAIVALQNAVAADPDFALAYARLGDVLNSLSRFREAYSAYQKALTQDQQRLTRRERDRLRGIYAIDTWDYATAESAFHDYTVYYPNDYLGWFYRGLPLMMMGHVEEAIASLKKAAQIDPMRKFAPAHIARYDLILGNYEEAASWIQQLREIGQQDSADLSEGESYFLQGRYQGSLDRFSRLTQSKDQLYRSYGYSLLVRLYAERGSYENALSAIERGIQADLESGDTSHRADKILDRAYIECRLGHYESCLQDTQQSLNLDRSLQRSLSAATLLGQASSQANGGRKRFVEQLRSIEAKLPPADARPLSDIVRMHVRGEALLAEGRWQSALEEFRKADRLEAPLEDKEYLGRALLEAAQHTSDEQSAKLLRKEALAAYSVFATKPGLVWQWAQGYFPGYATVLSVRH